MSNKNCRSCGSAVKPYNKGIQRPVTPPTGVYVKTTGKTIAKPVVINGKPLVDKTLGILKK